ncbi:tetratricopeptide repeat-containing diguanylate cyclase [Devosia sp. 2618]|uniref:tetratricopeptide repeat-containing diguanylate cyclase n=1 Tax=Devosia sp. 2618 TaxID=3156454 RepID=UPI003396656E
MAVIESKQTDVRSALEKGWLYGRTGRSVEGLKQAMQLLPILEAAKDEWLLADCMLQTGWFNLQLGHPDRGVDSAYNARHLFLQCGARPKHAFASAVYGWVLAELGLVDEGFEASQLAVSLAETVDDDCTLSIALHSKAVAYVMIKQETLAYPLLERALALALGANYISNCALFNVTMGYAIGARGDVLRDTGEVEASKVAYGQSIEYFDKAIVYARQCGDIWNLGTALTNRAENEVLLDQPLKALETLEEADDLPGPHGIRRDIHYLYTLGQTMLSLNRLDEALAVCERAVALAESTSHIDHQVNTLRRLAEAHEALGHFEAAMSNYKKYHIAYQHQMGVLTQRRAQMTEMRLENARLRSIAEQFERQATHDDLTGLPNRRSLEAHFQKLKGRVFAVAILDLDFFKQVNDRYSHAVGDTVLRMTGELLGSRGNDVTAFRMGGEEFALLFDHGDSEAAFATCEAIRQQLEGNSWEQAARGLRVTASIGLAVGKSAEDIMPVADARLYKAKSSGRNRVVAVDVGRIRFA